MKKAVLALSLVVFVSSCGSVTYIKNILKDELKVQDVVNLKAEMDKKDNPALLYEKTQKLKK